MDRPVLLDTHVWVWLMEGRQGVRPEAVKLVERAADASSLRVSIISAWEIAMLEAKGRLSFDVPCEEWVVRAFGVPGLSLMPLTPTICVRSCRLPEVFPGDPADRLIVSTARELGAVLVTRDEEILRYAAKGHVRAMRA